jgi:hypothetical protein
MDLKRVYSGPGSNKSDKYRVWPNPDPKCQPGKEVPGSGQICVSGMFMPDPDSGFSQFKCSGPGHICTVSEIIIPNPDSPSLNVPGPVTATSGSTSLPVAWCRAVGRPQRTADGRRMRASRENRARPSSC